MSKQMHFKKLASVFNRTSKQGKANFVKMLWGNQSADVRSRLMPLLNSATKQILKSLE
jgi:hypothetical protein